MKILRATHLGMCFGVRDAIQIALASAQNGPVTVLGELAHNPAVNEALRQGGVKIETDLRRVETRTVIVTAHGASQRTLHAAQQNGHRVVEATCPLVRRAHHALAALVNAGYHPVIVGRKDHVEVRGMTGDLAAFDVILNPEDVSILEERSRFGVVAQTTQPISRVEFLVNLMRRKFPEAEVRFLDTVCRPTKERQSAAEDLARGCDVVVVVGGANSNNTRELAETCRRHGSHVHQIERADQIQSGWLTGARQVGLTAGTSTPDSIIDEVERRLRELAHQINPGDQDEDLARTG
jgi:4-hydroxy-3-methylbut-2-en-1-yl diphosphate reductase